MESKTVNNKTMNKKRKSMARQIVIQLFLIFTISTTINGLLVKDDGIDRYIQESQDDARNNTDYLDVYMSGYAAKEWLVEYWVSHPDEINYFIANAADLSYDYNQSAKQILHETGKLGLEYIGERDASLLSDEQKKVFASLAYVDVLHVFDRIKRTYHPRYLYAIRVKQIDEENYESTFICAGTDSGEGRKAEGGDIFNLGDKFQWKADEYSVLAQLENGERLYHPVENFEEENYNIRYMVYNPVYRAGKLSYVICIELEDENIRAEISHKLLWIEIISSLILLSSIFVIFIVFRNNIVNPIKSLQKGVRIFAGEKNQNEALEVLDNVREVNELGELKDDLSGLVVEMVRYTKEIETLATEKERLDAELNIASAIQMHMLPKNFEEFSENQPFDVFAIIDPAKEVGGDLYDFFKIDDDHIGLVVADVSGKGIPASLFMMVAKTLIKQYMMFDPNPAEVLSAVNNRLCENNKESLFVTVWAGVYEISTGILRASNAGHEYPMISRNGKDYEVIEDDHGLYLAALEDMEYTNYEIKLEEGDTIFVYTDGVTDAADKDYKMFDMDRALESLSRNKEKNLSDLVNAVKADIDEFVGDAEQFDDITMLAFRKKS